MEPTVRLRPVVRTAAPLPVATVERARPAALVVVPVLLTAFGLLVFAAGRVPGRLYLRAADAVRSPIVADLAYRLGTSRGEVSALGLFIVAVVGIALAAVHLVA